jgi:class 3 adenylate cyclase
MAETRKARSHSCGDVVGYSRLAGSDEERTLAPLRAPDRTIGCVSTPTSRFGLWRQRELGKTNAMATFRSPCLASAGRLAFGGRFASDGFGAASALGCVSAKVLAHCAGGVL